MDQEACLHVVKKQYRMTKLIAAIVAGIFLMVLFSVVMLVPQASRTLYRADEVLTDLEEVTEGLAEADLPGLVEDMDALIVNSEAGVQEALEKVNAMDIETLNEAIRDLQAIVEPLARFFGR